MANVDFRCEQCGKLLSVEAQSGQIVKCPHCEKKVTVPEGLASLPRPQVPGGPTPPPPPADGEKPPEEEVVVEEDAAMSQTMSQLMPWILSLFLHLGIGLLLAFVSMVYIQQDKGKDAGEVTIVSDTFSDTPGGVINPGDPGSASEARQHVKNTQVTGYSHHDSTVTGDFGNTGKTAALIGVGGGGGQAGGGWAKFGVGSGGSGHGPKCAFIGNGGNAHHVVFCIDNSGSMGAPGKSGCIFDTVKGKMVASIAKLAEVQDFHILFFSENNPTEMPTKRLVPATPDYKAAAVKFMDEIYAHGGGGTDPIPALTRCFEVLSRADDSRKGKMVFLLTDGSFRDNDAVMRCIREKNKTKDVHICTYLYGETDDESIIKLMKGIASETGGLFKIIKDE